MFIPWAVNKPNKYITARIFIPSCDITILLCLVFLEFLEIQTYAILLLKINNKAQFKYNKNEKTVKFN